MVFWTKFSNDFKQSCCLSLNKVVARFWTKLSQEFEQKLSHDFEQSCCMILNKVFAWFWTKLSQDFEQSCRIVKLNFTSTRTKMYGLRESLAVLDWKKNCQKQLPSPSVQATFHMVLKVDHQGVTMNPHEGWNFIYYFCNPQKKQPNDSKIGKVKTSSYIKVVRTFIQLVYKLQGALFEHFRTICVQIPLISIPVLNIAYKTPKFIVIQSMKVLTL